MNNPELDLSNPDVLQAIVDADVNKKPKVDPAEDVEKAIQLLRQGSTFTMRLTAQELLQIEREAAALQMGWCAYLEQRVRSDVLGGKVGRSVITAPSFAKGERVTAPSGAVTRA